MTHTPGPWISGVTKNQTLMVYGPNNETVARIRAKDLNALSNTYLIAASPSLLSALQSSTGWMVAERDTILHSISNSDGTAGHIDPGSDLWELIKQIKVNQALIASLEG